MALPGVLLLPLLLLLLLLVFLPLRRRAQTPVLQVPRARRP
jgi:hypothetical protein